MMEVRGDSDSYACVIYDPMLVGESATQPKYRVCALRANHL